MIVFFKYVESTFKNVYKNIVNKINHSDYMSLISKITPVQFILYL